MAGPRLTPLEAAAARERETLGMSRKRLLALIEGSSNPRYRAMLERSVAELDERLRALG